MSIYDKTNFCKISAICHIPSTSSYSKAILQLQVYICSFEGPEGDVWGPAFFCEVILSLPDEDSSYTK